MNLRTVQRLGTLAILATIALGCGRTAPDSAAPSTGAELTAGPGAVRVVTTTTVFADIVKAVGGSRTDVRSIIPAGVGPEDYEPKPDDARRLADAQLIVQNGVGLDNFLDRLLSSGTGGNTPRLVLGEGIPSIVVDGEPNPHFWLDPSLVKSAYLPKIVTALSTIAPADTTTFQANAAAYGNRLDALDAELKATIDTIPQANRKLVTFHDAFPYFARHYGFELIGVVVANVGQEPTAADLAGLVQKVKAAGVKAVFSEAQFNPKLARTLADEAGIQRVVTTLYNDALGPAPAVAAPQASGVVRDGRPTVVIDHVTAGYGPRIALSDVSLTVRTGSLLAVIGPNGAGKSTLLKLIANLLQPESGTISVLGAAPGVEARSIAYLPQAEAVDWDFPVSVGEVAMMGRYARLGFGRRPGAIDRERVAAALEMVGMAGAIERQIGALSGGQRRRVFLARAIAADPELYLLDEPVTGVDARTQEELMDVLEAEARSGKTVIASTHDLICAAQRFHQAAFINGRVIATGPAEIVLDQGLLAETYGGHVLVLPGDGGRLVLDDAHHHDEAAGGERHYHDESRG